MKGIVCGLIFVVAVGLGSSAGGQVLLARTEHPTELNPFNLRTTVALFADDRADAGYGSSIEPSPLLLSLAPVIGVEAPRRTFNWEVAGNQSFFFLGMQHSARLVQRKTRREFSGKFFDEYANAISGLGGWGDTDTILTNYVGHPMMGAVAGWIQIQNDPKGLQLEFDSRSSAYWNSRMKAFGWAALYSTQFELGPISEASIGHVGKKRGTMGYVDLVMTPSGGLGWIVAEDALDKHFIRKWEDGRSDGMKRFLRIALNPNRAFANALRFKKPWHRDTRSMSGTRRLSAIKDQR